MNKNKPKMCTGYKPVNENGLYYKKSGNTNCKECVYFSSRNCGMDIADSIEPELDIFI